MDNSELLSAEDNLFGRMALYNQLVTPGQVAECTRAIFVEAVAGLPRRTLGEILVAQGYLSQQVARSIAEAVRKKLGQDAGDAEASPADPPQAAGPARVPTPAPQTPPTQPARARAGYSRVMVRVEAGAGPQGERIWVEALTGGDTATVKVACAYLYPNDAGALALACRQLLDLRKANLQVDMRGVDYVPSVILGEIAKAGIESWKYGHRLKLLARSKVAAVAEMVIGKIVTVEGS